MNKKAALGLHTNKRAVERLGFGLNKFDRAAICGIIHKSGGQTLVRRKTNRVSIHEVTYNEQTFRVVYDKLRHALVTVLPHQSRL